MKKKPKLSNEGLSEITLPWLIIGISSMIMFVAFLIAMFFNFHTAWFFSVWLWIVACALVYDGIIKRKSNKFSGNLSMIMGVLAFIAGVLIINMQK